jgi:hypothetical protein
VVIAPLDKLNQSFLAEGTGTPKDVLLDATAGAGAILIAWL